MDIDHRELDHINDPQMHISGGGPVAGFQANMSSARGEIHGQTALAIMSNNLLKAHNKQNMPVIFYGDNQPNHDLFLEYNHAAQSLNNKVEWTVPSRFHYWWFLGFSFQDLGVQSRF